MVSTMVRPVYSGYSWLTEAYPLVGAPKTRTSSSPRKARSVCSPEEAVVAEVSTATGTSSLPRAPTEVGVPPPLIAPSLRVTSLVVPWITKEVTVPSGSSGDSPASMGPMSPPPLSRRSTTTPHTPSAPRASARVVAYSSPCFAVPANPGTVTVSTQPSVDDVGAV